MCLDYLSTLQTIKPVKRVKDNKTESLITLKNVLLLISVNWSQVMLLRNKERLGDTDTDSQAVTLWSQYLPSDITIFTCTATVHITIHTLRKLYQRGHIMSPGTDCDSWLWLCGVVSTGWREGEGGGIRLLAASQVYKHTSILKFCSCRLCCCWHKTDCNVCIG